MRKRRTKNVQMNSYVHDHRKYQMEQMRYLPYAHSHSQSHAHAHKNTWLNISLACGPLLYQTQARTMKWKIVFLHNRNISLFRGCNKNGNNKKCCNKNSKRITKYALKNCLLFYFRCSIIPHFFPLLLLLCTSFDSVVWCKFVSAFFPLLISIWEIVTVWNE